MMSRGVGWGGWLGVRWKRVCEGGVAAGAHVAGEVGDVHVGEAGGDVFVEVGADGAGVGKGPGRVGAGVVDGGGEGGGDGMAPVVAEVAADDVDAEGKRQAGVAEPGFAEV